MNATIQTRREFIQLAGGVYHSDISYEQWSGADKWNNFWSFFFDRAYGWVTSLYGEIPVSRLREFRRHSIEHIIPRSVLWTELTAQNVPLAVLNGAMTNPFNLAPSDRYLNKTRSSFPFDFEGDRVHRPFDIYLNAKAKGQTGFDAEQEWVIPEKSRGDVARAVLYMTVIYRLEVLFKSHVSTLLQWATIDQPTDWEQAYNRWVQTKFQICNPLMTHPVEAFVLFERWRE